MFDVNFCVICNFNATTKLRQRRNFIKNSDVWYERYFRSVYLCMCARKDTQYKTNQCTCIFTGT